MKRFAAFIPLVLGITFFTYNLYAQGNAKAGFAKLNTLAGEWTGKGPNGLVVNVTYEAVAGGTAIMETRAPTGEPSMVSIFHMDGNRLMMTHYCSDGNQPRMRAKIPSEENQLDFAFIDVTNLATPETGHMRALSYEFKDKNHITQIWTWRQDNKDMPAVFHLERKIE